MKVLDGILVVDFTRGRAGSLCTMLLADFGAEVVKIERIGVDQARFREPGRKVRSALFAYLNRGKKSVCLNVASKEGRAVVLDLARDADIVCEDAPCGAMERLGLGSDVLRGTNPGLVYASLSAFGRTGPLKGFSLPDSQVQALSGFMDRTGFPDGPPIRVGTALGDQVGGRYMALGIVLSLIHRKKTGQGQNVDLAVFDSLFSLLEAAPMAWCLHGEVPPRVGNAYPGISPYDAFRASDGYVAVGISTDRQWQKFCAALGMGELAADARYATNASRGELYEHGLKQAIEAVTSTMSKFDIEAVLCGAGLACGAVCTVREAMDSDQIRARDMLVELDDKDLGTIIVPGAVIIMLETPAALHEGAPLPGEHTEAYLRRLGYTPARIAELHAGSIIETL